MSNISEQHLCYYFPHETDHADQTCLPKYIFLIYGCVTIGAGALLFFLLPDSPSKAWFFNREEKSLVIIRLAENQTGIESHKVRWSSLTTHLLLLWDALPKARETDSSCKKFSRPHILEALKDAKAWCIFACSLGYGIANAGITNFNPLIISGYGFSQSKTVLMATPQAGVAMVSQAILTAISFWVPNLRCIFWILGAAIGLLGAVMVHVLNAETQRAASLAGVYLMGFYNIPWVFMLSLQSSNTAGATKKSFMGVSVSVMYGKYYHPHLIVPHCVCCLS